ncbi:MAG TPA: protein kinase [Candidatus Eisenbacteria bacterium]|nr:protein kinase [Candidatus Eisenbacteria bacterium]
MIGTRLFHYRIVRRLGQGGMGVVYLAHDEKLDRPVALKLLPPHLLDEPAERARLLGEARAASALNHPGICVIHAIEDAGELPCIVMEYVEGETLGDRMRAGPLPVTTALDWALQLADALAEAHRRGLVHRDIKSDNVMITPAGRAKLMDFGLARIRDAGSPSRTVSTSGTLAYMAPEQFKDGAIDARADVYAFGVLLYEMLAGRRPFPDQSPAATMYAVLNTEPEPIAAARPRLDSEWQHVLDRALEKDPADRYQSMADVLIDLRRLQRGLARSGAAPPPPAPAPPVAPTSNGGATAGAPPAHTPHTPHAPRAPWWRRASRAIPVLAGLVALALAWRLFMAGPPRLNPAMTFHTLSLPVDNIGYPGMSQDGRWIAFPAVEASGVAGPTAGRWGIYFMNVNGTEVRPITVDSTGGVITYADVSPDGSQIAYTLASPSRATSELMVVPSLGGASIRVASHANGPHWSPDGRRIGYMVAGNRSASHHLELWSVDADGSHATKLYEDPRSEVGRISFAWSPDANSVAWIRTFANATEELFTIRLADGRERQLTHDGANIDEVCWTRQNDILFSSNRAGNSNLWLVRASGGPAAQVTKGAGPDIGMRISADGSHLLYLQSQPMQQLYTSEFGRAGARPLPTPGISVSGMSLSPDGRKLAFVAHAPDPIKVVSRLEVMGIDGSGRRALSSEEGPFGTLSWSPDGRQVAYLLLERSSGAGGWVTLVDAAGGTPRRLRTGNDFVWEEQDSMLVIDHARGFRTDVRTGGSRPTGEDSVFAVPMSDHRNALVGDERGGGFQLLLRDPAGHLRPLGGQGGPVALDPTWSWVIVRDPSGALSRLHLPDMAQTHAEQPPGLGGSVALTPDGRTLIYTVAQASSKLVMIDGLR